MILQRGRRGGMLLEFPNDAYSGAGEYVVEFLDFRTIASSLRADCRLRIVRFTRLRLRMRPVTAETGTKDADYRAHWQLDASPLARDGG